MQSLHVLTRKEDLDSAQIADQVVIVLDVLFATSTIVTALEHGACEVIPAVDESAARALASRYPAGSCLLAGEKRAEPIAGFAPYAPKALARHGLEGKRLIYSTTNGTVALRQAEGARRIYVAALLNAEAVVTRVLEHHGNDGVLILCAGSIGMLNLEDFYGAGLLVERLLPMAGNGCLVSDTALAARGLYRHYGAQGAEACLLRSRVGRMMSERGLLEEVRFAAGLDRYARAPSLREGSIR
jgi:2-phosphosulfolactate phosphatase